MTLVEEEPVSADNPLLNLPNVVVSAHMAGVTVETHRAMAMQVSAEMLRVLRGEGFEPAFVSDGDAALGAFRREKPDVVIEVIRRGDRNRCPTFRPRPRAAFRAS